MTTNIAVFLNLVLLIGRIIALILALVIGFNIWKQLKSIATELKKANSPQTDKTPEEDS